jgi:hypothetical protein
MSPGRFSRAFRFGRLLSLELNLAALAAKGRARGAAEIECASDPDAVRKRGAEV